MDIEINKTEKIYNDKYIKWTKKWYPFIKIGHFLFLIICIIILLLYKNNIINNLNIIWNISITYFIVSSLLIIIPLCAYRKFDYDYIEKYYPEISKKIWIYGRDNGIMNKMAFNELYSIEYGSDPIIDDIIDTKESFFPMFIVPFVISVINIIIAEFIK